MIQNLVGPPIAGTTELKALQDKPTEKSFNGSGSDSFGRALEEKMSSNDKPREAKSLEKPDVSKKESTRAERQEDKSSRLEAKTEKEVAKQGITPKKAVPSRQQAIKEFMDSFESEFEIPPTRLVEAMAALDETQLTRSPEATAAAVIDQLGLSEDDSERAQAMYVGLLSQIKQAELSPVLVPVTSQMPSSAGMSAHDAQLRFATAQNKQLGIDASVDRLNNRFWMKDAMAKAPATPGIDSLNGDITSRLMVDEESFAQSLPAKELAPGQEVPTKNTQLPELPPHLKGQMAESIAPGLLAALAAKQAASSSESNEGTAQSNLSEEETQVLENLNKSLEGLIGPKANGKSLMAGAGLAGGQLQQENAQQQGDSPQSQMHNPKDFFTSGTSADKEMAKAQLTEKAASFKQTMTGLEGLHATSPKLEPIKLDQALPVTATAPGATATPADNEASVKALMNQAQYLVKKGGGEVKVQMTPEGLGTVHLKMQVQDGKVNVQMSADTHEAKKTIESGLAELKTSLAAHKLSVDHVKVDVVNSASNDTAAQNNNMNGQSQKDARQFWNQFNENFGSQGRRESFLQEGQNLKGYGPRKKDPLQPIEASSVQRKIEGKGSGLNLVA